MRSTLEKAENELKYTVQLIWFLNASKHMEYRESERERERQGVEVKKYYA